MTPTEYGERKHESCRFGMLTAAFRVEFQIDDEPPGETPCVLPLCTFKLPEPVPPALVRAWGGAVEFDRDCAVCLAHQPVPDNAP